MRIIAIAIVGANGVIGDGERQPFEIAEDWARFKRVTLGHPLIMGRKTHDAIGRWLPKRTTIVVTSHPETIALPEPTRVVEPIETLPPRTAYAVASLDEALDLAAGLDAEIYVAGGGSIYRQAWPRLTDLDLTEVHQVADGSVLFPDVRPAEWVEVSREPRDGFDFVHYRRR
ncbi:MAG TPA: dihydrofolate reductase [Propionicimonas sp.]|nr:dihydrofolate reductase [Propionicimonas sp.]HQA77550.1 dihydrofolate reductase [Propionicimonas sp.]HQD96507.1 dihydrofolate reductase [Propionicimonas sp.]